MENQSSPFPDPIAQKQPDALKSQDEEQQPDELNSAQPENLSQNNIELSDNKSKSKSKSDLNNSQNSVSSRKSSNSKNKKGETKIISNANGDQKKVEKEIEISDVPYRRSLILKKMKEYESIISSQKNELRIAHIGIKELRRLFSKSIDENNELKAQSITDEKIKKENAFLTKENAELHITIQENTGKIALLNEQLVQVKKENEYLKKINNFDLNSEYQEHIENLCSEIESKDLLIEKFKKDVSLKNSFIVSTRSIQLREISLRNDDQRHRPVFSGSQFSDGSIEYSDALNEDKDIDGDDLEDIPSLNMKEQQMITPKNTQKSINFEEEEDDNNDEEEESINNKNKENVSQKSKSFSSSYELKKSPKNKTKTNDTKKEIFTNEEEEEEEDISKKSVKSKKVVNSSQKRSGNSQNSVNSSVKSGKSSVKSGKSSVKSGKSSARNKRTSKASNQDDGNNETEINSVKSANKTVPTENDKNSTSKGSRSSTVNKEAHSQSNAELEKPPKKARSKRKIQKSE